MSEGPCECNICNQEVISPAIATDCLKHSIERCLTNDAIESISEGDTDLQEIIDGIQALIDRGARVTVPVYNNQSLCAYWTNMYNAINNEINILTARDGWEALMNPQMSYLQGRRGIIARILPLLNTAKEAQEIAEGVAELDISSAGAAGSTFGRRRKVHFGSRGGRYIIKNGRKKYL